MDIIHTIDNRNDHRNPKRLWNRKNETDKHYRYDEPLATDLWRLWIRSRFPHGGGVSTKLRSTNRLTIRDLNGVVLEGTGSWRKLETVSFWRRERKE
ncbi:unnamed protein product [Microthlaspi erraticum]|uniref:Uncharacterized protein n=1 Tax=Microthlaspi erraticum TaxID=1685480 RepID=A0A6D2KXA1_9BRAS|nr:unnamed protein product [Microthlaspi erraticum]